MPRPPGALVDSIENTLLHVAACQPFEAALAIWESALKRQLVDRELLGRLHLAVLMLHGYHVIRVGYAQVVNAWPEIQELIMRAVAQGLRRTKRGR